MSLNKEWVCLPATSFAREEWFLTIGNGFELSITRNAGGWDATCEAVNMVRQVPTCANVKAAQAWALQELRERVESLHRAMSEVTHVSA